MLKNFCVYLCFLFMMISCSNNNNIKISSIVCFADSLTRGYGATENKTYPYYLQQLTNIDVINKGVNGNTSKDGLDRVDDILKIQNALIIVEFGANDFFQQIPISETKENMEQIVDKLQKSGNMVVLVSTEDKQLNSYYNMLKNIAKKKKILFIDGILNEIWNDRNLFSDDIHPNSSGYKLVAEKIYKNIKNLI